jgi:hypothetical protein
MAIANAKAPRGRIIAQIPASRPVRVVLKQTQAIFGGTY